MAGRVWMLTELFHPDQTSTGYIMTRIAERLTRDAPVVVLCGPAVYDKASFPTSTSLDGGIVVLRAAVGNWDKNRLGARLLRSILVTIRLAAMLMRRARRGDTVVLVTNPPTLLLLIAEICHWRGLRLVVIVHDVFPENLVATQVLRQGSLAYRALRRLFDRAYTLADRLIALGRDMRERLHSKIGATTTERVTIVENWAETDSVIPIARERDGPVLLQFAGNLGRVQGLLPLLDAVRRAQNPKLAVDILGTGALRSDIEAFVRRHGLTKVRILPPFPRAAQNEVLNDCDVGIVSLGDGMLGLAVPSKAYNVLAAGKPILFIGHPRSEIARVIEEARVGWVFPDHGEKLIAFLRSLGPASRGEMASMGQAARRLAEARYGETRQLDAYCAAILGV